MRIARRLLIVVLVALTGTIARPSFAAPRAPLPVDLQRAGVAQLAQALADRTALDQAARLDQERAQGRVRGPLHGIPVLVKDNIDAAGLPTTAGAIALRRSVPAQDSFLVKRLRAAGAIILGKTNLTEFANFMTTGMPAGFSALG